MKNHLGKMYETVLISENLAEIKGFDYPYDVTSDGRIISHARYQNKNMEMNYSISSDGYYTVGLMLNKKETQNRVHRIVACAFIPNPQNKPYVNHIDGNKLNNKASNLEWCTQKENVYHSITVLNHWSTSQKTKAHAQKMGFSKRKLTLDDAREIRRIYASGEMGCYRIAKQFGLSKPCVLRILHNETYKEPEEYRNFYETN